MLVGAPLSNRCLAPELDLPRGRRMRAPQLWVLFMQEKVNVVSDSLERAVPLDL
jgi:hypothetical protein